MHPWRFLIALAGVLCVVFIPAKAEIKLPPDIMNYATEGINGVYSLDFDTAQKNIQRVFKEYPDHPALSGRRANPDRQQTV